MLVRANSSIQLVIFDFDGTLVDTAPDLVRATNFYLESKGLDPLPPERIRAEIGMGLRKLIQDVMPTENRDDNFRRRVEGEFMAVYERELLHSPRPFEGVEDFLHDWDGQVAIVSNKRLRFILPILKHLGLDTHPWVKVIGGDTYPNMKPHAEPFLGAMDAAGVTPEETLIVGDGTPDIVGAVNLGSRSVAVSHGYERIDDLMNLGATYKIDSFAELLPLIRSL